ncbi:MAG: hypothetical protein V1857_03930 [archaeon]
MRDPVEFWLSRLSVRSRDVYRVELSLFLRWLGRQQDYGNVSAAELLERQRAAKDQYEILDLLQRFVAEIDRTANGKKSLHTAVRSFFMHNRRSLPEDRGFKIRAERKPVRPKLSLNHLMDIVKAANLRDRSIILVKWQAMLDNERTVFVGLNLAEQLVTQMKAEINPVRLDLAGRKSNSKAWYTFIGKDAIDTLRDYFEKERGWPKPDEPIWIDKIGNPFSVTALTGAWMSLTRRVGLIPKKRGDQGTRYGYNPHEMRDMAKSLLHTQAKKDGFDMDCAEFWLGHTVDPLGYDKFFNDFEYVKKQYLIAEKYLNIISQPQEGKVVKEQAERLQEIEERNRTLEKKFETLQALLQTQIAKLESSRQAEQE